jgi:hypothetical protein
MSAFLYPKASAIAGAFACPKSPKNTLLIYLNSNKAAALLKDPCGNIGLASSIENWRWSDQDHFSRVRNMAPLVSSHETALAH